MYLRQDMITMSIRIYSEDELENKSGYKEMFDIIDEKLVHYSYTYL